MATIRDLISQAKGQGRFRTKTPEHYPRVKSIFINVHKDSPRVIIQMLKDRQGNDVAHTVNRVAGDPAWLRITFNDGVRRSVRLKYRTTQL